MRYRHRTLLILLTLLPCAVGCHVISPRESTLSAITATTVRIHIYMLAHRMHPASLALLPNREGYADRITDGWGRELMYTVDDAGIITLSSYGRDGKGGGTGQDADISKRYRTRDEDDSLNIDDEYWVVTSEIQK